MTDNNDRYRADTDILVAAVQEAWAATGDPSHPASDTLAETTRNHTMTTKSNDTTDATTATAAMTATAEAEAKWAADADLRAEFCDSFENYLAFAKADAAGQIRVMGRRAGEG